MSDENWDFELDSWFMAREEALKAKIARREKKQNTIVHLTNPTPGTIFTLFEDEAWQIKHYVQYNGDVKYNRGIVVVGKPGGTRLYTIPHRVNGNVEQRTLQLLPVQYLSRIAVIPKASSLPTDIAILSHYSQFLDEPTPEITLLSDDRYELITSYIDYVEQRDESMWRRYALPSVVKWALGCMGATLFKPHYAFVDIETIDTYLEIVDRISPNPFSTEEPKEPREEVNPNPQIYYGQVVEFGVQPLEMEAEPDATILTELPTKPRRASIYPNDLERSMKTVLRYFDANEVVDMIKRLRKE